MSIYRIRSEESPYRPQVRTVQSIHIYYMWPP